MILFLVCFAVFLSIKDKNSLFLITTAIAVISALSVESIALFFKTKSFLLSESSVITGLIIGFIISSDEPLYKFVLAPVLAILSKYFIRFKNRHIFNPAAFGIFLAIVFFGAYTQWKGAYSWYILLPFGIYFAYKARKIGILIGYAIVTLALFTGQAVLQKTPVLNILGYLNYFYIFIMIIEPLTTPIRPRGKFIFGACLGAFIFILTGLGVKFDVELFSLLVLNMAVPMLNYE